MKKIIITESQLKRIFLEEQSEEYVEHKLYEDHLVKTTYFAPKDKISKLFHGHGYTFTIDILNKSKLPMTLLAKTPSDWGYRGEKDLNFSKHAVRPNDLGEVEFSIDANKRSEGGFFTTTVNITYIIGKTKKSFDVSLSFQKPSREETINYCKKFYNDGVLNKAKSTVLKWLDDPITIQKYIKNWDMSKSVVDYYFHHYKKTIKDVKLEYVIDPDGEYLAQVAPRNFNKIFNTAKFVPVTINCVDKYLNQSLNAKDFESVLIHEMQHLLNIIHPWHPESESPIKKTSNLYDIAKSQIGKITNTDQSFYIIKRLISDGFNEKDAKTLATDYVWSSYLKSHTEYLNSGNELASFVLGLRRSLNLRPGQEITKDNIIKNIDNPNATWIIRFYIKSELPLETFLSKINSYAKNEPRRSDTYNV
jgi:hypothetical protein